ncbi:MAG: PKD domain-containing protein [Bacteroidota bacterium]
MKRSLLLILALLISATSVFSAHIIGGELVYQCAGPDNSNPGNMFYVFNLFVYRDCFGGGAEFDNPGGLLGTVTIYQGESGTPFVRTIPLDFPEIEPIPPNASGACIDVPPNICVEKGAYRFIQSLPMVNESYYIAYQRCCRNNTIDNIVDPGGAGSTYYVEITPSAQQVCNQSPRFNDFPPVAICVNEPLVFDHSASDAEGDQLVYEFCSPLTGGTRTAVAPNPEPPPEEWENVDFVFPAYSALNPIGGDPQISIDPVTGVITGTPTVEGQFVVGICVKEFRNGELLSVLQRDFQFNVVACEVRVNADLDGVDAGATYQFFSCVDSTITIINQSTSIEFIDEYLWQFDLPGPQPLSYSTRDVTVTFPGPGAYKGIMILNPGSECTDTANIEIEIAPPLNATFEFDYDTCIAGPVSFFDKTINNGRLNSWSWRFGDGNVSAEQFPVHEYESPGLRRVTMIVGDDIGCRDTATEFVNWFPVPPLVVVDPSAKIGCPPLAVTFTNLSTPIDDTYDLDWEFGDGTFDSAISPTHIYTEPGVYSVSLDITSPIGCFTSATFPNLITVDSAVVADFDFSPKEGISNFAPEVTFTDQSRQARAWDWTFGEFGTSVMRNPRYSFPDTGLQEIQLIATHFYGCKDTITKVLDVVPQITFFMPNAFTPNNDSTNDFFRPGGFFRGIRDFRMLIFDRWGGLVFESSDPMVEWNGRKNNTGRLAPTGVYVCRVHYRGPRGQAFEYKGFVTLLK